SYTEESIPYATEQKNALMLEKLHNNLLYYAVDSVYADDSKAAEADSDTVRCVKRHLDYLEENCNVSAWIDTDYLNTLMKAYFILNRKAEAADVAESILSITRKNSAKNDQNPKATLSIVMEALDIVNELKGL